MPVELLANGARLIEPAAPDAERRQFARAGNFWVEWLETPSRPLAVASGEEAMVLFTDASGSIEGAYGHVAVAAMTLAIVPAGEHVVRVDGPGLALVLATDRPDLDPGEACNPHDAGDPRIAPVGTPYARRAPLSAPRLLPIAEIPFPPDNPRLRYVQSATMSINLVLYDGPRGKDALSPHKHADIEQGTLAIRGHYTHHLRKPWGRNAADWVADAHQPAAPGSLLLIPPEIIHTTEGVDEGEHFLLDIFAPPRADFIAKGWVANAGDYLPPEG